MNQLLTPDFERLLLTLLKLYIDRLVEDTECILRTASKLYSFNLARITREVHRSVVFVSFI